MKEWIKWVPYEGGAINIPEGEYLVTIRDEVHQINWFPFGPPGPESDHYVEEKIPGWYAKSRNRLNAWRQVTAVVKAFALLPMPYKPD